MKRIEIYYGSTGNFLKSVPKSHKNLTTLALECDVDAKKQEIVVRGQNEKPIKTVRRKRKISCLVAAATEYCAVQEHVISNFLALRAYLWVKSVAEMPVKPLHC